MYHAALRGRGVRSAQRIAKIQQSEVAASKAARVGAVQDQAKRVAACKARADTVSKPGLGCRAARL